MRRLLSRFGTAQNESSNATNEATLPSTSRLPTTPSRPPTKHSRKRSTVQWPFQSNVTELTLPLSITEEIPRRATWQPPRAIVEDTDSGITKRDSTLIPDYVINFLRGETPETVARRKANGGALGQRGVDVAHQHRPHQSRAGELDMVDDGSSEPMPWRRGSTPSDCERVLHEKAEMHDTNATDSLRRTRNSLIAVVSLSGTMLVVGIIGLVIAAAKSPISRNQAAIYSGDCGIANSINWGLHGLIAALAITLLAACNHLTYDARRQAYFRAALLCLALLAQILFAATVSVFQTSASDACEVSLNVIPYGAALTAALVAALASGAMLWLLTRLSTPEQQAYSGTRLLQPETSSTVAWIVSGILWLVCVASTSTALGLSTASSSTHGLSSFGASNEGSIYTTSDSPTPTSIVAALPQLFLGLLYVLTSSICEHGSSQVERPSRMIFAFNTLLVSIITGLSFTLSQSCLAVALAGEVDPGQTRYGVGFSGIGLVILLAVLVLYGVLLGIWRLRRPRLGVVR